MVGLCIGHRVWPRGRPEEEGTPAGERSEKDTISVRWAATTYTTHTRSHDRWRCKTQSLGPDCSTLSFLPTQTILYITLFLEDWAHSAILRFSCLLLDTRHLFYYPALRSKLSAGNKWLHEWSRSLQLTASIRSEWFIGWLKFCILARHEPACRTKLPFLYPARWVSQKSPLKNRWPYDWWS